MASEHPEGEKLTRWQRLARRQVRREAGRPEGEPLEPEDWEVAWKLHYTETGGLVSKLLHALPSSPRCGLCGAPCAGFGSKLAGPLGYRPSRKNPTVCGVCVELAPPAG